MNKKILVVIISCICVGIILLIDYSKTSSKIVSNTSAWVSTGEYIRIDHKKYVSVDLHFYNLDEDDTEITGFTVNKEGVFRDKIVDVSFLSYKEALEKGFKKESHNSSSIEINKNTSIIALSDKTYILLKFSKNHKKDWFDYFSIKVVKNKVKSAVE